MTNQRRKPRRSSRFGKILGIYTVCALLLLAGGLIFFWQYIAAYEDALPARALERYLAGKSAASLYTEVGGEEPLPEGVLSYQKCVEKYSARNPVYTLLTGERAFAYASLTEGASGRFGFSGWNIRLIPLDPSPAQDNPPDPPKPPVTHTLQVRVPAGAVLTVGGQIIPSEDATGSFPVDDVLPQLQKYIGTILPDLQYTIKYEGDQLPQMTATDSEGNELTLLPCDGGYVFLRTPESLRTALAEQHTSAAREFIRAYIRYNSYGYSNTQANLDAMLAFVLNGSPAFYDLRDTYTAVHANSTYQILSEEIKIDDFIMYHPDCFSCRADFSIKLQRYAQTREDSAALRLYFVRRNGQWQIAFLAFAYDKTDTPSVS